jgi:hypothetical protein
VVASGRTRTHFAAYESSRGVDTEEYRHSGAGGSSGRRCHREKNVIAQNDASDRAVDGEEQIDETGEEGEDSYVRQVR